MVNSSMERHVHNVIQTLALDVKGIINVSSSKPQFWEEKFNLTSQDALEIISNSEEIVANHSGAFYKISEGQLFTRNYDGTWMKSDINLVKDYPSDKRWRIVENE